MQYGGFWRRFVAYIIDAIVLSIVAYPILMFAGLGDVEPGTEPEIGTGFWLAYLAVIVINWLYFALLESSGKQATLGKMALGMVVTDLDGNRVSFGKASGRFFGKILSGLILLIGYIMAAFTERKQALHDMLAGTLVLKGRSGEVGANPATFA